MSKLAIVGLQKTTEHLIRPVLGRLLQRSCACGQHTIAGGECAECRQKRETAMQRAATDASPANAVPQIVHDVLSSTGQPLDAGTRAFMESRFGHDFSQVRVHTDARAAESAHTVNALAYTVGRDIVFRAGEYVTETDEGRRLLAHELTHVVQQQNASDGNWVQGKLVIGQADDAYEHDAEALATLVIEDYLVDTGQVQEQFVISTIAGPSPTLQPQLESLPSRPVFICSKWLDPLGIGASAPGKHAFFRIGGSGPGNDTVELEHEEPRPGCFQGVSTTNDRDDVPASATCISTSITEASLMSNKSNYPIGKYCTWGPNSNTYVREVARLCGVSGIRPPGPIPGFDDSPPSSGTFAPSPYSTVLFGCSEIDCRPRNQQAETRTQQVECVRIQGGCANVRPGGIPTHEELDSYNDECRKKTNYTGPNVIPTDEECRGQTIPQASTPSSTQLE